jgi:hypothetical protein
MDNLFKQAAEYHMDLARRAAREGNSPVARRAYRIAVRAWRKAIEVHPSLINYLIGAEKEYLSFVRADAVYPEILGEVKRTVTEHPGILKSDLCTRLGRFHRADLENVLDVAIRNGDLERRKVGSSFELRMPVVSKERGLGRLVGTVTKIIPFVPRRIERRLPSTLAP